MSALIPINIKWRVYIVLHGVKYYANRSVLPPQKAKGARPQSFSIISWKTMAEEYPDHYDYAIAYRIADKYSDQKPLLQQVVLQYEEEDAKL